MLFANSSPTFGSFGASKWHNPAYESIIRVRMALLEILAVGSERLPVIVFSEFRGAPSALRHLARILLKNQMCFAIL